jgi:GTP-binding protein HflX
LSLEVKGNSKGLSVHDYNTLLKLYERNIAPEKIVSREFARELFNVAAELKRRVGVLVTRDGSVVEVFIGTHDLLYLPPLGRYRLGNGRLRRLRLIFSDLSRGDKHAHLPGDIMADLEKLRLESVIAVKGGKNKILITYAHLIPNLNESTIAATRREEISDAELNSFNYATFIASLEAELSEKEITKAASGNLPAMIIAVSENSLAKIESSVIELTELCTTAGLSVRHTLIQRRKSDPRSVLGKGKLEEAVLLALRLSIEVLVFENELRPSQWRTITNATAAKILDRSMVILDIFARRAKSAEGRLQVELAQLKYNLPRLVERDSGLSRLTGGIGGRGPGETKLEISRRRSRDRINELERRILKVSDERKLRKSRRSNRDLPLIAIVGYTNAGKSSLFNLLTKGDSFVEDRLFATLDTYQRRGVIFNENSENKEVIFSDTVGFIRALPDELINAFKATLEELNDASILLHLYDVSDIESKEKIKAVRKIIESLGLGEVPELMVGNKSDLLTEGGGEGILISVKEKIGIKDLRKELHRMLNQVIYADTKE